MTGLREIRDRSRNNLRRQIHALVHEDLRAIIALCRLEVPNATPPVQNFLVEDWARPRVSLPLVCSRTKFNYLRPQVPTYRIKPPVCNLGHISACHLYFDYELMRATSCTLFLIVHV